MKRTAVSALIGAFTASAMILAVEVKNREVENPEIAGYSIVTDVGAVVPISKIRSLVTAEGVHWIETTENYFHIISKTKVKFITYMLARRAKK